MEHIVAKKRIKKALTSKLSPATKYITQKGDKVQVLWGNIQNGTFFLW